MSRMKVGLILAVFILVASIIGCSPAAPKPTPAAPERVPLVPVPEKAPVVPEKPPVKVRYMSAAGGSPGGTYFFFGAGIAKIVTKYVPGVHMTSEATTGSVENARLIALRKVDIGQTTNTALYLGGRGEKFTTPDEAVKWRSLRAVSQGQVSCMQFVTLKKSGITTIADLKDKRVSFGPVGGAQVEPLTAMMTEYGLSIKDVKPHYMGYAEGVIALKEGSVDVAAILGGIPTAGVLDLSTTHDIRILSVTTDRLEKIFRKNVYWPPVKVPGGTYRGVPEDVWTVNLTSFVAVHKDMEEELCYQIIKALCDHADELIEIHPEMKVINPKDGVSAFLPYHPGAIRYFKEKGTWDLRPKAQAKTIEEFLGLK